MNADYATQLSKTKIQKSNTIPPPLSLSTSTIIEGTNYYYCLLDTLLTTTRLSLQQFVFFKKKNLLIIILLIITNSMVYKTLDVRKLKKYWNFKKLKLRKNLTQKKTNVCTSQDTRWRGIQISTHANKRRQKLRKFKWRSIHNKKKTGRLKKLRRKEK